MAINSIKSSTSADALSVSAKAQPDRTRQSSKNQVSTAATGKGSAMTSAAPAEALKPVVNAQGQTTGRIINTQA